MSEGFKTFAEASCVAVLGITAVLKIGPSPANLPWAFKDISTCPLGCTSRGQRGVAEID